MKALTEIKINKYDEALYMISYYNDNDYPYEVGVDYTSNLAELLDLLVHHAKHSSSYQVFKITKGE